PRLITPTDATISLHVSLPNEPVDPRTRKTTCPPSPRVFRARPGINFVEWVRPFYSFYRYQRSRSSPSQRRRVPIHCTIRVTWRLIALRLISPPSSTLLRIPTCAVLFPPSAFCASWPAPRTLVQILSGLSPGP